MSLVKRNLVIKITNTQPAFNCPNSTTETPEQGANHAQSQWCCPGVFTANAEHTPHTAAASPSPIPNMQLLAGYLQLKLIL